MCAPALFGLGLRAAVAGGALDTVTVEARALPGANPDPDQLPGSVQSISAAQLARDGTDSLTQAMNARFGSVSVNDNLGDANQSDLRYRGFAASPVLGTPQGLALYQNGVRINEAFGDTANWDLIPQIAIRQVDLVSTNPVYGLNALGGAVAVGMNNGFDYQGHEIKLSGGSFRQRSAAAQWGVADEHFALYLAGTLLRAGGWRRLADDSLRQAYAAVTSRREHASVELSYTLDDYALAGQGSAPARELAISPYLGFTGPQLNANRLQFLTLNTAWQPRDGWMLQGLLYYRQYHQQVVNGNTTAYGACSAASGLTALCQPDGLTPLQGPDGLPLPDISQGGSLLLGENDSESITARSRGVSLQAIATGKLWGADNQFSVGAALDLARVGFLAGTELGVLNAQLLVGGPALTVNTPESSVFNATPVALLADNSSRGLYFSDALQFPSGLTLTASARQQQASIDLLDQRGSALNGRNRYAHFNPQLGAVLPLSAAIRLFANLARSTRTPTASEIECSDPLRPCLLPSQLAGDPPALRQVVADTIELGLRSRTPEHAARPAADRRSLAWNFGLFRSELNDDIYGVATAAGHGYFLNIGGTRRQGMECGLELEFGGWTLFGNYSYTDATFQTGLVLPSPWNPFRDTSGNIQVSRGDQLPGVPRQRFKTGVDYQPGTRWTLGATLLISSGQYYFGDEANRNAPLPGYGMVGVHGSLRLAPGFSAFATVSNLFDRRYATYGIYSDPTGAGAPGIPAGAVSNAPGIDNRFYTPAAPLAVQAGLRLSW